LRDLVAPPFRPFKNSQGKNRQKSYLSKGNHPSRGGVVSPFPPEISNHPQFFEKGDRPPSHLMIGKAAGIVRRRFVACTANTTGATAERQMNTKERQRTGAERGKVRAWQLDCAYIQTGRWCGCDRQPCKPYCMIYQQVHGRHSRSGSRGCLPD